MNLLILLSFNVLHPNNLTLGLVALILTIAYAYLLSKKRNWTKWSAILILVAGTVIYLFGFNTDNNEVNWVSQLERAAISSAELFIADAHLEEVHGAGRGMVENSWWMLCFMTVYGMALTTSFYSIYSFFFTRKQAQHWLKRNSRHIREKRWYMFWGLNTQSLLLARDIRRTMGTDGEIVFIDSLDGGEDTEKHSLFDILFGNERVNPLKKQIRKEIRNAKIITPRLALGEVVPEDGKSCLDIVGLEQLKSWFAHENVDFFILSDNYGDNLRILSNILGDEDHPKANFYCRVARNDYNDRIELCSNANINLLDVSHISIQELIRNHKDLHPVNYVEIKESDGMKMGCVKGSFNCMVVGFGEVGQEALKYLYQFGAFSNGKGRRSDFKCYAVDRNMDAIEGDFISKTPGAAHDDLILYENDSIESASFWKKLKRRISSLNYIVVSLGDDKLNVTAGLRILEYAKKYRENLHDFVILVRDHEHTSESAKIEKIYNEHFSEDGRTVFKCFASDSDIWQYSVVTNSVFYEKAGKYHRNYTAMASDGYDSPDWDQLNRQCQSESLETALGSKRKVRQNYDNYLFAYTLRTLCDAETLGADSVLSNIPVVQGFPENDDSLDHYMIPESLPAAERDEQLKFRQILTNLADTEHIRWKAALEMNGYIYGKKTDDICHTHKYMVECSDLKKGNIIHYDWIVVKQSLKQSDIF